MDGWQSFEAVAAARGGRDAVVIGNRVASFADLRWLALRLAGGMVQAGVRPRDRIVLQVANGVEAAALPLAIWALGAVPVFAPADVGVEGVAQRVGAALVVSDRLTTCTAAPLRAPDALVGDPAQSVARLGKGFAGEGFESQNLASTNFTNHDFARDDFARDNLGGSDTFGGAGGMASGAHIGSIVFTSGSTGRPKGVVQRQTTLLEGVDRVAAAVGFGPCDRMLCAVPFAHDYGWGQLLAMYRLGLTLVLAPPGLAGLPEAIERHRPTVIGGVPSVYAGLTRGVSDIAGRDRASVRLLMSTGSVMPDRVWGDLADVFPGARRCLNYGLTETFRSATLRAGDAAFAPGVVGSSLPGSALCVVDDVGQVLPAGEWGEVVHRGAGVFEGYWQDPEQTALRRRPDPVTGQGFAVFTGDRGWLDAEGRLTLGDRMDRMVKVMGLAASPAAIEAVLRGVAGVEAVAVVSRPHAILGGELVAVVVVAGAGVLAAAQRAAKAMAPHERPRAWVTRDALPLTASGKVDLVRLSGEVRQDGQIAHPTHEAPSWSSGR